MLESRKGIKRFKVSEEEEKVIEKEQVDKSQNLDEKMVDGADDQ